MIRLGTKAYDELIGLLYSPEDRQKIEWAVGAAASGNANKIMMFCGPPASGKSTILRVIDRVVDDRINGVVIRHDNFVVEDDIRGGFFGTQYQFTGNDSRILTVNTTGAIIPRTRYDKLMAKAAKETKAISRRCVKVYKTLGADYYDTKKENI